MTRIHPFGEGNGRTARLVMNYIQYYHGYPLSFILSRDRDSYDASLDATDRTSDLKHFETFMMKASLNAFRQGIETLKPSKEYKNPLYER
ncbi:MAG: Fic family protein [Flavobacteriaceae bacterium]|nr:Fic family protein [Flavobacteriaceae bacterium]